MGEPAPLADRRPVTDGAPTEDLPLPGREPPAAVAGPDGAAEGSVTRMFGSRTFFRLWLAMLVSSLGDWIGFVAITALSNRLAGQSGVALVLSARMIPGFFFGSVGGVIVDRFDRKKVMVVCDVGRGLVVATLPFVDSLPGLFAANLALEGLTLLWTPAKEATVPNLVPKEQLPRANSLSLAAAYGTFPVGAALFTGLAGLAAFLGRETPFESLRVSQENLAIWTDTTTFLVSALMISTLALPRRATHGKEHGERRIDLGQGLREVREGWRHIGRNHVVRAVMVALATGLVGGGMVVPVAPVVAEDVLGGGPRAFGALITALGVGVALGVVGVSSLTKKVAPEGAFVQAILVAGVALGAAASMWTLTPALLLVGILGLAAGVIYVLGFALIQANTEDELRGRTFAALYAMVRLCLLISFVLGPLLASVLGGLSDRLVDGQVGVGPWDVTLQGGRLALWVAGSTILIAGLLARRTLRRR